MELAKALGFLPLALDHAGAYMASRKMTFARYAKVYRKNFARIFNQQPKFGSYQERTLYTTWEISFREIERQDEGASKLLLLCSFLSNEDIWDEMLRRGLGLDEDGYVNSPTRGDHV